MEESFPRTLESPLPRRPQSPWEGLVLGDPGRRGSFLHEKGWDSPSRLQSLVPAGSHEAAVHVKRRAWAEEVVSGSRAAAVVFAPGLFALTCSAGNTDFTNPSVAVVRAGRRSERSQPGDRRGRQTVTQARSWPDSQAAVSLLRVLTGPRCLSDGKSRPSFQLPFAHVVITVCRDEGSA